MSKQIDLTQYENILAIIQRGRQQTAAMASGRQPGALYPATDAERAQLETYAAALANGGIDFSDVEAGADALLGG